MEWACMGNTFDGTGHRVKQKCAHMETAGHNLKSRHKVFLKDKAA